MKFNDKRRIKKEKNKPSSTKFKLLDDFLGNFEKQLACRYTIQECVQICIDIAFHLCIINEFGEPTNYKDVFKILKQNQILSDKLSKKKQYWVGVRNLVSHIYEDVDDARIYSFIVEDLNDFEDFILVIYMLQKK
ncbi:MAG: type VII toxin-antitoxin system HepT family RNase toxin [Promethearchaeota archaeon]